MQYLCIISMNMLKHAKTKYAHICKIAAKIAYA